MARKLFASLLLFTSLLCSSALHASHMAGGEITYKYIGNSTHPYRYEITLKLYRRNEPGSANPPTSATVHVSSSCFSTQSVTMNRWTPPSGTPASDGGYEFPAYLDCGDSTADNLSIHLFGGGSLPGSPDTNAGVLDLPGKCADFKFSYDMCCRAGTIVNLSGASGHYFYIRASLNNVMGENSSPEFRMPPAYSFCLNQSALSLQSVMEADGDSTYYRLSPALDQNASPIPYQNGFSGVIPLPSSSPITMDKDNGILSFTPSQIGTYTVVVSIEEYRFDSILSTYFKIGEISRDYNIVITQSCNSGFAGNLFGGTGVSGIVNGVSCGDSTIVLPVGPILSTSLSPDGTDFAILSSKGFLLPLIGAEALMIDPSTPYADSIVLYLADSVYYNDTLTIFTRKGSDFNTLINTCGIVFPANDSAKIIVNDCKTWVELKEKKVATAISVYPNPANGLLTIDLEQYYPADPLLKIRDIEGKVLKTLNPGSQKVSLDISGFAPGMYLVTLESENAFITRKFQKL